MDRGKRTRPYSSGSLQTPPHKQITTQYQPHIRFTPYKAFGSERWPLSFCSSPRCCGTETSNEERPPPPGPSTPSPPEIPPTPRCLYCTGGAGLPGSVPWANADALLSTTKSSMSTTGELSVPGGEVRDATAPKPPFNPPGTRFRLVRPDPQRAERLCSSSPRSGPAACQTADRWHPRLAPP